MKQLNYQKGKIGEGIAEKFLIKNGYEAIKSNFQNRWGEIDLIMTKKKTLVFVEVKLKVGDQYGAPEEMINPGKIKQITRIGQLFIQQNPKIAHDFPAQRVDAVCIVLDENKKVKRINHYKNIS